MVVALVVTLSNSGRSVIEISWPEFEFVTSRYYFSQAFSGTIRDSNFELESFGLVFTIGCANLYKSQAVARERGKTFEYSSKFILMGNISTAYQRERIGYLSGALEPVWKLFYSFEPQSNHVNINHVL